MTSITLLDGGMSRELQRNGATLRQPEWSALALIETPQIVEAAHDAFLAAGAQVITTNSYAVVPFHLGQERFDRDGAALAALSAGLARSAADRVPGARVAGCLPPPCGSYQPESFDPVTGGAILDVLVAAMADQVDLWLAETLSSLAEARAAAQAVAETGAPLWLAFTLQDAPGAEHETPRLRSGETVTEAVALAQSLGAEAVLFNCSMPEVMAPALSAARAAMGAPALPLGVYANAFDEHAEDDGAANETLSKLRADLTPEGYLAWADRWVAAGASLIGGCCGIDAPHIAALAAHLGHAPAGEAPSEG